ncbi:hypothetical protein FA13DRAFT_387179 [Coprinellus micaceus]|uniref:Uncharacterized protein n=1 Tax=Coprinellus micaceus TaxID=71717 RepID=A0A4Y7TWS4_COPMI|nr:hypothetical protein FA13DRAFT_387179 [Coprinellus micaceus]
MNPVVYANRAAAHLATKEYIDAVFDCEKATKLDPTYAKAWARLGTALYELSSWDECSNAWNKALEHLSKPTLTPSELALKIQVEDGLKLAQEGSLKNAASAKLAPVGRSPGLSPDTSPCTRAAALTWRKEREIQACKTPSPIPPSCVFTLNYANACISAANRMLNTLAHAPAGQGLFAMATSGAVFENLTSAILLDERVFHVEAPHEFYGKLAKQYFLESLGGKSLVEGGGLDNIRKEVLKRLQEQDWETEVAPVVSLTVRYWIFQAHWRFYLYGPTFFSYLLYTRVIEFLEWGSDHWPHSPESVLCGGTFREDLLRGVMRLRLQTMQALLGTKPPDDLEHLFTMNDLVADAHELIDATNAHEFPKSSSGLPIGQVAAFWSHYHRPRARRTWLGAPLYRTV